MASNLKFKHKIDDEKSRFWALSSLGSEGVSVVVGGGVSLFHLVNRTTHRGHRFEVWTGGVGLSPILSGSIGSSDYVNFQTTEPKNFLDFDGTDVTIRETDIGLYGWTTVSFWGMSVRIAGGGLNIPGLGVSNGVINIMFGDGKPLGLVDLEIQQPKSELPPDPVRITSKNPPPLVYQIGSDVLFAFKRSTLKPGQQTEEASRKPDIGRTSRRHQASASSSKGIPTTSETRATTKRSP